MEKSSIQKKYPAWPKVICMSISSIISLEKRYDHFAGDIAFLNIYNKSEDEVLRLLISKLSRMGRFICQYIKRDGSICGNGSMSDLGCYRHINARLRTICPVCKKGTYSDTGICSSHSGIYAYVWRESNRIRYSRDT